MDEIPAIGFGTWRLADGSEAAGAVKAALKSGYRLIDTAKLYGNEHSIGHAIALSPVPREQIYLTTKLWNADQGYASALRAFDESAEHLAMDYIDLYLIHWPGHDPDLRRDSWRALLELNSQGRARAIGVSNYKPEHLAELLDYSPIKPAVNQIEFHPFVYQTQKPTLDFCAQQGIIVEAYSPLAHGTRMDNPLISRLADTYHKSNAQILLRWCLQHGTVPLPKSATASRIAQNIDVFDFELSTADMQALDGLSGSASRL